MTEPGPPAVSIIVPVLNEAAGIVAMLDALQGWRGHCAELIVVDGGSTDDTCALAAPRCDRLIDALRGRAAQMNAGAASSRGALLLFLHADTTLPPDAPRLLASLAARAPVWGRFDVSLSGAHPLLGLIASCMNWRSRLTAVATGDQAMFISRDLFAECGGFPVLPLMEDIALSKHLRRVQRPACLASRVVTSGRRWEEGGVLRTMGLMWALRLGYVLGVPPARLARWYRHTR